MRLFRRGDLQFANLGRAAHLEEGVTATGDGDELINTRVGMSRVSVGVRGGSGAGAGAVDAGRRRSEDGLVSLDRPDRRPLSFIAVRDLTAEEADGDKVQHVGVHVWILMAEVRDKWGMQFVRSVPGQPRRHGGAGGVAVDDMEVGSGNNEKRDSGGGACGGIGGGHGD